MKQYLHLKPIKWGFRWRFRCVNNTYCSYEFDLYLGKIRCWGKSWKKCSFAVDWKLEDTYCTFYFINFSTVLVDLVKVPIQLGCIIKIWDMLILRSRKLLHIDLIVGQNSNFIFNFFFIWWMWLLQAVIIHQQLNGNLNLVEIEIAIANSLIGRYGNRKRALPFSQSWSTKRKSTSQVGTADTPGHLPEYQVCKGYKFNVDISVK